MTKTETVPFDAAPFFDTPEAQRDLIEDALQTGNATYIAEALGVVARGRGIPVIAQQAGVSREALYKALSPKGDPRLSTFVGVLNALGIRLTTVAAPRGPGPQPG